MLKVVFCRILQRLSGDVLIFRVFIREKQTALETQNYEKAS